MFPFDGITLHSKCEIIWNEGGISKLLPMINLIKCLWIFHNAVNNVFLGGIQ